MTEDPEQRVARLQHELDQAKIDDLQKQLAAAQAAAGLPVQNPPSGEPPHPRTVSITQDGVHVVDNAQIQDILEQIKHATAGMNVNIGGDGRFLGVHLGKQQHYGAPADGRPLAPPPRKVPWQFKVLVMPWSWWTWFAVLMISVTPVALYIGIPLAGAVASAVGFLVIVILRIRRDRIQLALLKWGAVANVVDAEPVSVGTYYSGTTYQNVRMAQAHGWQVERKWYSGPGTKTKISYELNGVRNELILHGLPYDNGVILADTRRPERALCISSFAYDLDRDTAGDWVGKLPGRVVVGAVLMSLLLVAWAVATTILWTLQALSLHSLVR